MDLRFGETRDVLRPLYILELAIIDKVEVVELSVVQLGVQAFTDQFVNILYLTIHVFLKHPKSLSRVEDLKRCHSP